MIKKVGSAGSEVQLPALPNYQLPKVTGKSGRKLSLIFLFHAQQVGTGHYGTGREGLHSCVIIGTADDQQGSQGIARSRERSDPACNPVNCRFFGFGYLKQKKAVYKLPKIW